jgi:hypothetical protein
MSAGDKALIARGNKPVGFDVRQASSLISTTATDCGKSKRHFMWASRINLHLPNHGAKSNGRL